MSYTFGAATGDDLSATVSSSMNANGNDNFMGGWFYPTTLTAGRAYMGVNATTFMAVGTTSTANIRFAIDYSTTDSVWETTGAAITTNKWWFIGVGWHSNDTGPIDGPRCWIGDASTPPTEFTFTSVTGPSGTHAGSAALCIGNSGSAATVAIQGDVGGTFTYMGTAAVNHPGYHASGAVWSQAEADAILSRIMTPLWRGEWPFNEIHHVANNSNEMTLAPLVDQPVLYRRQIGATAPSLLSVITPSGATLSQNLPPFRYTGRDLFIPRLARATR